MCRNSLCSRELVLTKSTYHPPPPEDESTAHRRGCSCRARADHQDAPWPEIQVRLADAAETVDSEPSNVHDPEYQKP